MSQSEPTVEVPDYDMLLDKLNSAEYRVASLELRVEQLAAEIESLRFGIKDRVDEVTGVDSNMNDSDVLGVSDLETVANNTSLFDLLGRALDDSGKVVLREIEGLVQFAKENFKNPYQVEQIVELLLNYIQRRNFKLSEQVFNQLIKKSKISGLEIIEDFMAVSLSRKWNYEQEYECLSSSRVDDGKMEFLSKICRDGVSDSQFELYYKAALAGLSHVELLVIYDKKTVFKSDTHLSMFFSEYMQGTSLVGIREILDALETLSEVDMLYIHDDFYKYVIRNTKLRSLPTVQLNKLLELNEYFKGNADLMGKCLLAIMKYHNALDLILRICKLFAETDSQRGELLKRVFEASEHTVFTSIADDLSKFEKMETKRKFFSDKPEIAELIAQSSVDPVGIEEFHRTLAEQPEIRTKLIDCLLRDTRRGIKSFAHLLNIYKFYLNVRGADDQTFDIILNSDVLFPYLMDGDVDIYSYLHGQVLTKDLLSKLIDDVGMHSSGYVYIVNSILDGSDRDAVRKLLQDFLANGHRARHRFLWQHRDELKGLSVDALTTAISEFSKVQNDQAY